VAFADGMNDLRVCQFFRLNCLVESKDSKLCNLINSVILGLYLIHAYIACTAAALHNWTNRLHIILL